MGDEKVYDQREDVYNATKHGLAQAAGSGVVHRRAPSHKCVEPEPRKFDVGDIFECRCGARYTLTDAQQYQGGPCWVRQTGSKSP